MCHYIVLTYCVYCELGQAVTQLPLGSMVKQKNNQFRLARVDKSVDTFKLSPFDHRMMTVRHEFLCALAAS